MVNKKSDSANKCERRGFNIFREKKEIVNFKARNFISMYKKEMAMLRFMTSVNQNSKHYSKVMTYIYTSDKRYKQNTYMSKNIFIHHIRDKHLTLHPLVLY